jgi:CBS domain-containing protein
MEPTVKDVMTTRVFTVTRDASFQAMATGLREHRVSAFPVVDDAGQVIGVVSEADMLTKEALGSAPHGMPGMITGLLRHKEHEKARGVTAAELMTSPPVTVSPDDTLEHAARLMYSRKVKRLPVLDADRHLVGIIGRSDLLSVFSRPDADIRREILDHVLKRELLTDPMAFTVVVKAGIVTMTGVAETNEFGHEIVQRIGHVPGVVAVRDRLNYPPPPEPAAGRFDVLTQFPVD